jgi:hypothetical protein
MPDATDQFRGVANREIRPKAGAGNPGTYLGTRSVGDTTYARYRAAPGTWISSSLKQMGYDGLYGKDTAYGAYRGIVRTPKGTPIANPDKIKPGQEYLVPLAPKDEATRISTAQTPKKSAVSGLPAPRTKPQKLSTSELPEARAKQNIIGKRGTESDFATARKVADDRDWEDKLVVGVLAGLITNGKHAVILGREAQQEQMEKVRGRVGEISDWLHNIQPPHIAAWTNVENFFVLAEQQVASRDFDNAISTLMTGYSSLTETQHEWHEYVEQSIKGAGKTGQDISSVRDTAVAVDIALATGDLAAPAVGGVGAVLAGGAMGVATLSESDSPVGEGERGTLQEIGRAGFLENMKLARQGLTGIAFGIGESLNDIPNALKQLPATTIKLLQLAQNILVTLFQDPSKLLQDMVRLPEVVELLYEALNNRWEWLKSLPPDKQAFEIGRLSGHIEAVLMAMKMGPAAGAATGDALKTLTAIPKGWDASIVRLVGLRTQVMDVGVTAGLDIRVSLHAVGVAAGQYTAVAMAASPGGGTSGYSNKESKKPVSKKPGAGDTIPYGDKRKTKNLERHEVLQNMWLRVNDIITGRKKGMASLQNPTILLPAEVHRVVGTYQRALGLFNESYVKGLSYKKVLSLNALALKHAGANQSTIMKIMKEAVEHAVFSIVRGY